MSQPLSPIDFPLHGSRLIEASAGTGKTWTIATLYLRFVLGHGGDNAFVRPLLPAEILVMTFTRAATRELSDRIRARLIEAAKYFRGEAPKRDDEFLRRLIAAYAPGPDQQNAAYRLMLAAESMDDAAIFTIDAWCQRMLREHAFDSGNLFDEALLADETMLFEDAIRDYWRQHVYPLPEPALAVFLSYWEDLTALEQAMRPLVKRADLLAIEPSETLTVRIERIQDIVHSTLVNCKEGWVKRANSMQAWLTQQISSNSKCFHGTKLNLAKAETWFDALRSWASNDAIERPVLNATAWNRLNKAGIIDAFSKGVFLDVPIEFDSIRDLQIALEALPSVKFAVLQHAACAIVQRMADLKRRSRQFSFTDMQERLKQALEGSHGATLRSRMVHQFPVALIDEFQDTAPVQYGIFNQLYRVADNDPTLGIFLIGDPKQSIYAFRGADIYSYLAARQATAGRHYLLDTNYRSTEQLVAAVNQVFLHAEGGSQHAGYPAGAFGFRCSDDNPLPFEAVAAKGRAERFVQRGVESPALTFWQSTATDLLVDDYRTLFAAKCAEHIVGMLNDATTGFVSDDGLVRLKPADIAVLVRDRNEAAAVRRALQQRKVASVYLSDKDSVISSVEASDVLRWLRAVANPLDERLARAALATTSANLSLATLMQSVSDDLAWEQRVEQLKSLHIIWQRQGVLAMLRQFIHQIDLASRLLAKPGGERSLTNLLHLAELLQGASQQLDGEQALIRWLAEQIDAENSRGDEMVLRLESDANLVKVVTVHKSKGLEYPLVCLPFGVSAKPIERKKRSFLEVVDETGHRIDFAMSNDTLAGADRSRLAEDLRLFYVALTRAHHALWMGVAALPAKAHDKNKLHECALGYLLAGGDEVPFKELGTRLHALKGNCSSIALEEIVKVNDYAPLALHDERPELVDIPKYLGRFERNWSVASFTSVTRSMTLQPSISQPLMEKQLDADEPPSSILPSDAPWHRFPRGPLPGNFLHEQLEWLALEGFDAVNEISFDTRMAGRCERAGWGHRQGDVIAWLRAIATTPLPALGVALCNLANVIPEMEFWFPCDHLATRTLDAFCRDQLLGDLLRPELPERELHGMLKGYADLVFEHEGRYWVLDYKSNALGGDDAAYHLQSLASGMAAHRYEIQGMIYLLALHRLLRNRLGTNYDPERQLGGAMFMFLRGIASPGCGCYVLDAQLTLLDAFVRLFDAVSHKTAGTEA
ncbi:MAG: exodeoxyribonuclease V subunit beta [Pseudomonadales bacterium]|nr:exodeoxyribonuclease V subunit beta [Pseudomonadales bacterium]